ncbi:MAG TPA: ABC transporter ATP-binding protein [Candidatus Methylomirabilis sp.]|nr:ABC transporter ATP-binding protein [Candidatus Methylomirabilis sp.]
MSAVLEVRGVTKQFGGLRALDGVGFAVEPGELVGLVGPNGAGKSTLFNIIAGAFPPTRGRVIVDGRDVTGLKSHVLARRGVARTFQQVTLFTELNALDNVLQGLHRHVPGRFVAGLFGTPGFRREQHELEARALRHLEFLGIAGYRNDTAGDLPLGIQKLLSVAVALATEPILLLLDEPAAGLSHEEAVRMMQLVSTVIRQRCTVVLVEHNMRIVSGYCDRAIVLHFGQTIYDGAPSGLTADRRVVDAYLGVAELG